MKPLSPQDMQTVREKLREMKELSEESARLQVRYDQLERQKQLILRERGIPFGVPLPASK